MSPEFVVLGMHGDTTTVTGSVARVRMFVGDNSVDEDFQIPRLLTVEEQLKTAIEARFVELKEGITDPSKSMIVKAQAEQIIRKVAKNV